MTSQYQQKLTKALTVCAIVLGISIGLCGLNAISFSFFSGRYKGGGSQSVLIVTAYAELAAIILSFLGLIIVAALMLFAVIFRRSGDTE